MTLPRSEKQFARGTARLFRDCAALDALTAEAAVRPDPRTRLEERVGPNLAHLLMRALAPAGMQEDGREANAALRRSA